MGSVQDFTGWPMAQPELAHRTLQAGLLSPVPWEEMRRQVEAQRAQQARFASLFRRTA